MADVIVKDLDEDGIINRAPYSDYLENIDLKAIEDITKEQDELAAAGCQLLYAFVNNSGLD